MMFHALAYLVWCRFLLIQLTPVFPTLWMQPFSRVRRVIWYSTLLPNAINKMCDGVHLWPQEWEVFRMIEKFWGLMNGPHVWDEYYILYQGSLPLWVSQTHWCDPLGGIRLRLCEHKTRRGGGGGRKDAGWLGELVCPDFSLDRGHRRAEGGTGCTREKSWWETLSTMVNYPQYDTLLTGSDVFEFTDSIQKMVQFWYWWDSDKPNHQQSVSAFTDTRQTEREPFIKFIKLPPQKVMCDIFAPFVSTHQVHFHMLIWTLTRKLKKNNWCHEKPTKTIQK